MRLVAVVGVLVLLLGVACSQSKPRTLQLTRLPTPTPAALLSLKTKARFPPSEPELAVSLEEARWDEFSLITLWKITNVGSRRLAELQWQIALRAVHPKGEFVQELLFAGRNPLPITATLYPGEELVGERQFLFDAPVAGVVINVSVNIGLLGGGTYTARYKIPPPPFP